MKGQPGDQAKTNMPPTPEEIEAAAQSERDAQQEAIDELELQDREAERMELELEDEPEAPEKSVDDAPQDQPAEADPAEKLLTERFGGDAKKAAAAYLDLEKLSGRQGNSVGAMRKTLEDQGYTFDDAGNPVAPRQEPAPQMFAGRPLAAGHTVQYVNGQPVEVDKYGAIVISDQEWEELRESDPDTFLTAYPNWVSDRAVKKANYEVGERQRVDELGRTQRAEVEGYIAKIPNMADNPVVAAAKAQADEVFARMSPEQKMGGVGYDVVFIAALSPKFGEFVESLTETIRSQEREAATQNKVVISRSSGGGNGPSAPDSAIRVKLSPDEDAARVKFNQQTGRNVKPSEWRANSNG